MGDKDSLHTSWICRDNFLLEKLGASPGKEAHMVISHVLQMCDLQCLAEVN